MLYLFILCLIPLHLTLGSQQPGTCEPGSTFKIDCNWCRCGPNGRAACTKRGCLPDTNLYRRKRSYQQPPNCAPGTVFEMDCNKCTCTEMGVPVCTRRLCPGSRPVVNAVRNQRSVNSPVQPEGCTPGTNFKWECNMCTCEEDGIPTCTKKGCHPRPVVLPESAETRKKRSPLQAGKCEPGTHFMNDCNSCVCGADGIPACTLKLCSGPTVALPSQRTRKRSTSTQDGKCEPGTHFMDDCNSCVCGPDGIPACTLKLCSGPTVALPSQQTRKRSTSTQDGKCEPGTQFKDDCNDCFCGPDGTAACTIKLCSGPSVPLPSQQTRKRSTPTQDEKCVPGTRFTLDCNRCTCSEEGLPVCSKKRCGGPTVAIPSEARRKRASEQDEPCTPGSEKTISCNHCMCENSGRWVCSRKICPDEGLELNTRKRRDAPLPTLPEYRLKRASEQDEPCTPGSEKNISCNLCICENFGGWVCSRKICPDEGLELNTRKRRDAPLPTLPEYRLKRASEQDEPCTPGSEKNISCNHCTCENFGGWVCSRKICPEEGLELNTRKRRDAPLPNLPEYRLKRASEQDEPCIPGSEKNISCNHCICESFGWVCSRRICPGDFSQTIKSVSYKECNPGEYIKDETTGATCLCPSDGKYVQCDPPGKPILYQNHKKRSADNVKPVAPGEDCTPGTHWDYECNSCFCSNDGKAACTLMLCLDSSLLKPQADKSKREVVHEQCTPGSEKNISCNRCTCGNFRDWVCTKRLCPEEGLEVNLGRIRRDEPLAIDKFDNYTDCTPGEFVRDGAGFTCSCPPTGKFAVCPHLQAIPYENHKKRSVDAVSQIGPGESCVGEDHWMYGCESCYCSFGVAACTKMSCPDENEKYFIKGDV